jgi:predicted enzyme related to lactoylglutathione lyase
MGIPALGVGQLASASAKRNPTHADVIAAGDQDRSVAFYTLHFGWRQDGDMDMGDLGSYRFLCQGETMVGAIMPRMPQVPRAAWTFYIGVGDIDRAAERRVPAVARSFTTPAKFRAASIR